MKIFLPLAFIASTALAYYGLERKGPRDRRGGSPSAIASPIDKKGDDMKVRLRVELKSLEKEDLKVIEALNRSFIDRIWLNPSNKEDGVILYFNSLSDYLPFHSYLSSRNVECEPKVVEPSLKDIWYLCKKKTK
jgi:hypothetical protein